MKNWEQRGRSEWRSRMIPRPRNTRWLRGASVLAPAFSRSAPADTSRRQRRSGPYRFADVTVEGVAHTKWAPRLQSPDLDVTVAPELSANAGETDKRFRVLKLGAAGSAMSSAPNRVVKRNQSYA